MIEYIVIEKGSNRSFLVKHYKNEDIEIYQVLEKVEDYIFMEDFVEIIKLDENYFWKNWDYEDFFLSSWIDSENVKYANLEHFTNFEDAYNFYKSIE